MEVGQPAARRAATAIAAARAALASGRLGYTEALGIAVAARAHRAPLCGKLRRRPSTRRAWSSPPDRRPDSSWRFSRCSSPATASRSRCPGYPPYRHILTALGCEPVADRDHAGDALGDHAGGADRGASQDAAQGRAGRKPRQSDRHHDAGGGACASSIAAAEGEGIRFISDEIYHGLDYAFPAETAAQLSDNAVIINSFSKYFCMTGWRVGWMVVPEALVRPIDRLQGNLAISVPTLSQIAAEAAFDGRAEMEAVKHGYEENRRILVEGLPKAGLDKFLPVDGAFYLYADVSRFSDDSFEFAKRMLAQTHVAATPGIDFDPRRRQHFIRFCYAGSAAEMHEAVERMANWLRP